MDPATRPDRAPRTSRFRHERSPEPSLSLLPQPEPPRSPPTARPDPGCPPESVSQVDLDERLVREGERRAPGPRGPQGLVSRAEGWPSSLDRGPASTWPSPRTLTEDPSPDPFHTNNAEADAPGVPQAEQTGIPLWKAPAPPLALNHRP